VTWLLVAFTLNAHALDKDTTPKHTHLPASITYLNNLSASYIQHKNWKYNGYNNYSFLLRDNINYDSTGEIWETHLRCDLELGYMKFIDSTWYKNTDCINLSIDLIKNTNKTFENNFSFYFNSQLLSSYENYYNDSGYYSKRWVSGFGNPMNIDLSYGTTIHFWKTCRLAISFVTLRTSTTPLMDSPVGNNDMIYNNTLITSEYGIGLQTFIRKKLGTHLRWENCSRAFTNAINRTKFDLDFRNRFIVKIFKYMDLIVDNRIRYTPYPPYKFQFRNELMISFTMEKI
jgi:hypothetical protein